MKTSAILRQRTPLRHGLLAGVLALALPAVASADAVTYWNKVANDNVAAVGGAPLQYRAFAMAQIAVHDALNAIEPRYATYTGFPPGNPYASREAAVAAAARGVLVALLPPVQDGIVEADYANYLAGLSCPADHATCIEDGAIVGEAAAQAILALRANDGSATPHLPYAEPVMAGMYQPTLPLPPNNAPYPQFGNWGNVTPFALANARQFAPGRSDFLNMASNQYTQDFNEVKVVGSAAVRQAAPNSEESLIARHFTLGPGANVNGITRSILAARGLDTAESGRLWENARLFALIGMAVNDGLTVVFNAKYRFKFWRPYTAIRNADIDGNPETEMDAGWQPYLTTPPYPDYPCGLPSVVSTSTSVLRDYFGTDAVPFDFGNPAGGFPMRHYDTLSQAANESAMARVYSGIHFRSGCFASVELGQQVGHFVYSTQLKPLP